MYSVYTHIKYNLVYIQLMELSYYSLYLSTTTPNTNTPNLYKTNTNANTNLSSCMQYNYFELKKCKLPELKSLAKQLKLHVSGRKEQIIERIMQHKRQIDSAIRIQRLFRGHIVRYSFRLRGTGFRNHTICTNQSDFYSLEPLAEIDFRRFVSISLDKQHIYGYDIMSLVHLFKQNNNFTIQNPYNRETFSFSAIYQFYQLFQLCKLIFPNAVDTRVYLPHMRYIRRSVSTISVTSPHEHRQLQLHTLQELRKYPYSNRVHNVFMEIDRLGNYSSPEWFLGLEKAGLANFYKKYYEWWNLTPALSREVKQQICALNDPFHNIVILMNYTGITIDIFRETCLALIECMVYSGVDDEHRRLGALHVLSILTLVSPNARQQMPWLFESIVSHP